MKHDRKQRTAKILVDTEVRRSARLSALPEGYRKVQGSGPGQIRSPHTLNKRNTMSTQCDENSSVPPPTAIADLQRIGARLRIASEKISTDKLVANPAKSCSSQGSDD